jgi:chromosomal replication initiator protein
MDARAPVAGAAGLPAGAAAFDAPADEGSPQTFAAFVAGSCNALALRAARRIAEGNGRELGAILFAGPPGCGKTHLLRALHAALLATRPPAPVLYVPADRFHRQFVCALQGRLLEPFRRKYRTAGVLLLDDLQRLATLPRTQDELLHTLDALLQPGHRVVVASDRPPRAIEGLHPRLQDRLQGALVLRLERPDATTRTLFLRGRVRAAGLAVPDAAVAWLAAQEETSFADLERGLTALAEGRGTAGAGRLLEVARRGGASAVTVDAIARRAAAAAGVAAEDLRGSRRTRALVEARRLCFHLGRALTPLTLEALGRAFGGRDHATVLQSVRDVAARRAADPAFDRQVASLEEALRREGEPPGGQETEP